MSEVIQTEGNRRNSNDRRNSDSRRLSDIVDEDEIDLKELFIALMGYKYKIALLVIFITSCTFVYVLSIPNSYKSSVILSPQNEQTNISGGLSSLASLAGVNLGSGGSSDPSVMMTTLLKDYNFNEMLIKKYNLTEKIENQENLVFALSIDFIYKFFNSNEKKKDERSYEEKIFNTINKLRDTLSISSDKDTNLITLSAELNDRVLAKDIVDIYLEEIIQKIKMQDMKEIDKQIKYYNKELSSTFDVSLKEQLSKSLSALMQKRVFSQANDYYLVSKIVDSRVAYIKEKTKPKRALILIVSFVSSIILGIFLAFFIEFIKREPKNLEK